ncbi:unnamed protein product [Coccothraustes coccothraustes]
MQALTHAEDAHLELPGAKRLLRAAFGRSRALESTATGTMLSARRSRFFASASRRALPLLRQDGNLELPGAKRRLREAFSRSRALESTATGTMLSARRSRFFPSGSWRALPLLRREERSRTTLALSAQPSNP